ncbi:hypothetical protein [Nocardia seriolae]|nr:hypothetical protein [Nocardia seriolae]MTJ74527.1 hypothetical protein [Nocardia seriolae]MTJ87332.1 hypothetical protein [Nocardia seriolae]MTK47900.1 hypothetical protein [Nocardia seriolae]QOW34472.1 hypothetical protein IMZ23_05195 [Nocardia seriolae]QUN18072.1 hypothetical protein KEC46_00840 [Nocardia seriolae]
MSNSPHHPTPFGTGIDQAGWLRREIPALGAKWLDVAEARLHELVALEQVPVPPNVAGLLEPGGRALLRLALLAQLNAADLDPVPGGCEIPWSGCPEHGDMLSHRGIVPGWYCDAAGHERYGQDTTFHRLRHCQQPAAAVLHADGYALAVCSAHLHSELERGSCGGEAFTVTAIDPDQTA